MPAMFRAKYLIRGHEQAWEGQQPLVLPSSRLSSTFSPHRMPSLFQVTSWAVLAVAAASQGDYSRTYVPYYPLTRCLQSLRSSRPTATAPTQSSTMIPVTEFLPPRMRPRMYDFLLSHHRLAHHPQIPVSPLQP